MQHLKPLTAGVVAMFFFVSPVNAAYTVQRVVGGLNQPMYVTQAPGDDSALYIVERSDGGNQLGRVRKYDFQTQSLTTFVDVSGTIISDGGLLSMAFHPEYQTNGLFYLASNASGANRLDEYQLVGGAPQMQRRLLQYENLNNVFHTINQPFFRPNGDNSELFVTAGDGGTQADDPDFNPALIESPDSVYGKLMRFDLDASFPTPAADTTHPGVDVVALGLRNPYRASFDRETGDFYIGDVGFNTAEEVNFIPASHFANPAAPALDFGWTDREGTVAANPGGGPKAPGDVDPIFDYAHSGQPLPHPSPFSGGSITGGYVYRGPVLELQERYFLSDFINGNIFSGAFDPATDPASYDGTNLTDLETHTSSWESLVGGGADIHFVTSFGEDNAGNLYVVKFGDSFFPSLGEGELFRVVPVGVSVVVDRESGAITLTNNSGAPISFTSLSISSSFGAVEPALLTPITGNYDSKGSGAVDDNNPWTVTSPAGSHTLFSEMTTGDAGTIGDGQQVSLSAAGGWARSPNEDLSVSLLDGGNAVAAAVAYIGNGGQPLERSDLDFDGEVELDDWTLFAASSFGDLSGLSPAQAYYQGDLDGDGDNDHADFRIFKQDFDATHGVGAFAAATGAAPEPAGAALMLIGLAATLKASRSHFARSSLANACFDTHKQEDD